MGRPQLAGAALAALSVAAALVLLSMGAAPGTFGLEELTGEVVSLDIRVGLLERAVDELRTELAMLQQPSAEEPPAETTGELAGRDLIAWKLAREAAEGEYRTWRDRLGRAIAHHSYRGPGCSLVFNPGAPLPANMKRTSTDDYCFMFGLIVRNDHGQNQRPLYVYVTDYGSELRVSRTLCPEYPTIPAAPE
jgi:hypothetical protein